MDILATLLANWKNEGVFLKGESQERINTTFYKKNLCVPNDVIFLYSSIGGMLDMDSGFLRLWTLDEIENDVNNETLEYGLAFSDYLMCSCIYRIKQENENKYAIYSDYLSDAEKPKKIADSLNEFFKIHLEAGLS